MTAQFQPITSTPQRVSYSRLALRTVVWKFREVEDVPITFKREPIRCPADLFVNYRFMFDDETVEKFVVFALNSGNVVQVAETISTGLLNTSLTHPREVFRYAVVNSAASIILAHNHPSGNPEPSQEDIHITKQLTEAGRILGIPVHDHIIFTKGGFISFAERELL